MALWGNGSKTKPRVSSKYGPRTGGAFSFHYGTDFIGYSDLKAILGGTVTMATRLNNSAGNTIAIDSKLPDGRVVTIVRMHVGRMAVRRGQKVSEGQSIGTMGSTGNATGPCDHVEVRFWSGGKMTTVDPEIWLAQQVKGSGGGAGWNRTTRSTKAIQAVVGAKQDNIHGPETDGKIRAFQKKHGLVVDGIWGAKSDAKGFPAKPKPAATSRNPFGIPWVAGLQKIANLNGGRTAIDQIWGAQSAKGFAQFLRARYGYKGNDVLGPVMWAAIARWLRAKYGYVGNDTPGPVMRAALQRAEAANYKAL